jgi:2-phospho-L-lactate/phosphoenolpyruvate guanylyltransferase
MIVAAVPIKDLAHAKQRLVSVLTPAERGELARAMLHDVVRALAGARLDRVWVVTRDPAVTTLARALGAESIVEEENRGHTAAVALAQAEAARQRARVFLTVPGDVPRVTSDEIRQLADAAAQGAPVFVPSRSELGTNGVALAPPRAMALTFGEPSFERHLDTARARGLAPRVLRLPGLGLDIDAPEDLARLVAEADAAEATETGRLIATWRREPGRDLVDRLAAGPGAPGETIARTKPS